MEEHKLDSQFKKVINQSGSFYNAEAKHAKERVWNKVKSKKAVVPLFYRLLAVASILLLIILSSSVYFNVKYQSKINQLVETNDQLKTENNELITFKELNTIISKQNTESIAIDTNTSKAEQLAEVKYITDTVYLREIVYVEKEVPQSDYSSNNIASSSTERNSTSKSQTEEVITVSNQETQLDQNLAEPIAANLNAEINPKENVVDENTIALNADSNVSESSFQKDIIIKSNKSNQKKKSRGLKIKFGQRKSKIEKDALALSTNISR